MFVPPDARSARGLCFFLAVCSCLVVPAVAARSIAASPQARPGPPGHVTAEQATALLRQIAAQLAPAAAASREVLLGTRDLRGDSCVRFPEPGKKHKHLTMHVLDPNGGPAGRLVAFAECTRFDSAKAEFRWFQGHLRPWLARERRRNQVAARTVELLSVKAQDLARGIVAWRRWPAGFSPAGLAHSSHWPGRCLRSLNDAVAARDLDASRRWARELAAALFTLADLHRWFDLLLGNMLFALDFQARCESLFDWTDSLSRARGLAYRTDRSRDRLAGCTTLAPTLDNLHEVERQAEVLFGPAKGVSRAAGHDFSAVPAAVWMPPDLRKDFLFLRSRLGSANRLAWDRAASTPLERSYLANILFRMSRAKAIDDLAVVLQRFDGAHPRAGAAELMDVIFYRGEVSGGLMWADRFDSRLMRAAGGMSGSNEEVLSRAHKLANAFFSDWENYASGISTLREALDARKLDCVRGTDMIGSLYRNAGRSGYYCLRLCAGIAAHSASAASTRRAGRETITIADSLAEPSVRRDWPSAFYRGYTWPREYRGDRGPVFAVELYARGLDSYVLAEGYIIRGPNAGALMRAALPHLPGREKALAGKVYAGPHPKLPSAARNVAPAGRRPGN